MISYRLQEKEQARSRSFIAVEDTRLNIAKREL